MRIIYDYDGVFLMLHMRLCIVWFVTRYVLNGLEISVSLN